MQSPDCSAVRRRSMHSLPAERERGDGGLEAVVNQWIWSKGQVTELSKQQYTSKTI